MPSAPEPSKKDRRGGRQLHTLEPRHPTSLVSTHARKRLLKLPVLEAVETGKHVCQDTGVNSSMSQVVHPAEFDATFRTLPPGETPAEAAHEC